MNWNGMFAARVEMIHRSTVREFLKLADRPGMISFAGGLPAPELFPIAEFQRASEAVLKRLGSRVLQYGATEGVGELRALVAERNGVGIDNVVITSGAQQALDLIGRVIVNRGDRVLVENPTYLALLSCWRPIAPIFRAVSSDEEGLDPSEVSRSGKILYLIPNFQNPQGTTLSGERRVVLAELAMRQGLVIVEDDPYGGLRYEGDALPSLFSLADRENGPVIHVGTFSKVLAPGLRVGWVIAGKALIEKLVLAKQAMDLHTSTWNQYLACDIVANGFLDVHIPILRDAYRARRDVMLAALKAHLPESVRWTKPAGGMFLFVTLPPDCNAAEVARAAISEQVLIVPGEDFHIEGGRNTFRLNFSSTAPDQIRAGILKLGAVVKRFSKIGRRSETPVATLA